jgi:hypothetical protein
MAQQSLGGETTMKTEPLRIVNEHVRFPRVSLVDPAPSVYLHIAAEVDKRPPFLWNSAKKKRLIADCKRWCERLEQEPGVVSAVVFDALLIAPGRGRFIEKRRDQAHVARFDLAVLIETEGAEVARRIQTSAAYSEMEQAIRRAASYTHAIAATNVKRIDAVDHDRPGVFLFNYFFADSTEQNLAVWEYTAGWFQKETGLDNSTVLLPTDAQASQYNIINHCRWDKLVDVLPSLIFKRTFRTYVLANFEANDVAAMPILYRVA